MSDFLRVREQKIGNEIDRFSSDYVLKVSLTDLTEHLADKYRIEPVTLMRDQILIGDSGDTKADVTGDPRYSSFDDTERVLVPAVFAEFVVPFSGEPTVFRLRPSTFDFSPPRSNIVIVGQELIFRYTRTDHVPQAMRAAFDQDLKSVEQYLTWGTAEIERYNANLKPQIQQWLNCRKEKFLKDMGLVEALGFPIKSRSGASQTYAAPVTRRRLPIQRPTATSGPFKPEPVLEMEHYEHILNVISNMVLVMERSPGSFARLDEEALRTHILVQLNGQYEGQATGETFNAEGKTDILVRVEGKNIFIAECKFWKGAEVFKKTIDQLLGYVAWRDTKTAIIVFNRNKDTSAVVGQIPSLVKGHPNFKREVTSYRNETGSQFVLHHRDDKSRELTLTVLVFDVPS